MQDAKQSNVRREGTAPDDLPLPFVWDGEAMRPPPGTESLRRAAARYAVGNTYLLAETRLRSRRSHDHYFAALHDAWLNLPEAVSGSFPTEEHLRKYALIKTGFYKLQIDVMDTERDAMRLAVACRRHDFVIVTVTGSAVYRYSPMSQSKEAMGHDEFQRSKQAVLDYLAELIKVDPDTLRAEAGQAA